MEGPGRPGSDEQAADPTTPVGDAARAASNKAGFTEQSQWRNSLGVAGLVGLFLAGAAGGFIFLNLSDAGPSGYLLIGGLVAVGFFSTVALIAGRPASPIVGRGKVTGVAGHALESLPDPCLVTDRRGAVLFANQAYRHLGLDAQDRPMPLERLLAGQSGVDEQLYQLAQAARLGLADEEELRFVPPAGQGRERVFKAAVQPLTGVAAKSGASIWLLRDMTAERLAAAQAQVGRDKYLAYLDDAPFGFFSAQESGQLDYVNQMFATMVGRSAEELTSGDTRFSDLVAGDVNAFVQEKDGEDGTQIIDVDLAGPDGPVQVRIVQNFAPTEEGAAGPSRSVVMFREEEDDTEAHLRDAEMRFARFFNNAPIGVATLDKDGVLGSSNAAFVTLVGGTPDAGSRFSDLVVEEDRGALKEFLDGAISSGGSRGPIDLRFQQKQGEEIEKTAQLFASYSNETGGQPSVIAYLIDTSEQKSLEMQFAQSQKMQAVGAPSGGRPELRRRHADQAERQPGGEPGAPTACVLPPSDLASESAQSHR